MMFSDMSPVMSRVLAYAVDDMDPFARVEFLDRLNDLINYDDDTGLPILDHVDELPHEFRLRYEIDSHFERLERWIREEA